MATVAEIQAMIAEVEAARHALAAGDGAVVEVWRDGRRVKKQFATLDQLESYLRILRSELAEACVLEGITPTTRRRPIRLQYS